MHGLGLPNLLAALEWAMESRWSARAAALTTAQNLDAVGIPVQLLIELDTYTTPRDPYADASALQAGKLRGTKSRGRSATSAGRGAVQ